MSSNSSLYLILFEDDYYLTGNANLLELSKYSFSGNNIYNIGINTTVNTFLNNVVNKDDLGIKFYSVLGAEIKNSNVVTVNNVNVVTNSVGGYTLNATVGNSTTYNTRK